MTQEQKVVEILEENGCVDNFYCINNKVTIRLGAVIEKLRKKGWEFQAGYIGDTKNWRYTTIKKPEKTKMREDFIRKKLQTKLI